MPPAIIANHGLFTSNKWQQNDTARAIALSVPAISTVVHKNREVNYYATPYFFVAGLFPLIE